MQRVEAIESTHSSCVTLKNTIIVIVIVLNMTQCIELQNAQLVWLMSLYQIYIIDLWLFSILAGFGSACLPHGGWSWSPVASQQGGGCGIVCIPLLCSNWRLSGFPSAADTSFTLPDCLRWSAHARDHSTCAQHRDIPRFLQWRWWQSSGQSSLRGCWGSPTWATYPAAWTP